jgi:hypothetical protein
MLTASPIDCSSIRNVTFSFSNLLLKASASDNAHDCDDFFDETGAILDPQLLSVINDQVQQLLDLCDGQPARIPSIMNKFCHKFCSHDAGQTVPLCTQSHIEQAFKETLRRNETVVKIIVMCDSLHFHPDFNRKNKNNLMFTTHSEMMTHVTQQPPIPSAPVTPLALPMSASITQPAPHVPANKFPHPSAPSGHQEKTPQSSGPQCHHSCQPASLSNL